MNCDQVRRWLERDLDGAAEPSGDVAAHLERCRDCAAEAGRTKAIAEAARAALPAADVPVDFVDQVLDEVLEPAGDQRLVAAARPRLRRWLPLVAVAALLPVAFLLRPAPQIRGDLRVERAGEWVAAKTAEPGETVGLEPGGAAERGEIRITAQEVTLLQEDEGAVMLLAGDVTLESTALTVADTPLGEIRLQADSVCVATLECEGEAEMKFVELKRAVPVVLAVTVLAGGATVVNAQGMQPAGPGERVIVEGSNPPRLDPVAVQREFDRMRVELEEARRQLATLRQDKPRAPDVKRQIAELDQVANANKMAIMQLSSDLEYLRLEKDSPKNRARIAELEEALRQRIEVAKVHDQKRQALEKRLTADEILKESRDLTRMAEELREEMAREAAEKVRSAVEDEVSDAPFEIGTLEVGGIYFVDKEGNVQRWPTEGPRNSAEVERFKKLHLARQEADEDTEKSALKAEVARLKKQLRKEQWVWRRDQWDLAEFLASRYAFQRKQLAEVERQLKEDPDDAGLRARHAELLKGMPGLEREMAEARKDASRRERTELKKKVKRLKVEISDLKRRASDEQTKARIKQLEEALDIAERELARGDLQGRVIAAKEGIVVLSLGSNDGVAPGWHFNVHRGNQWIARVVVTDVKEGQTVARLDLKRAETELTPQKGDLVKRAQ